MKYIVKIEDKQSCMSRGFYVITFNNGDVESFHKDDISIVTLSTIFNTD